MAPSEEPTSPSTAMGRTRGVAGEPPRAPTSGDSERGRGSERSGGGSSRRRSWGGLAIVALCLAGFVWWRSGVEPFLVIEGWSPHEGFGWRVLAIGDANGDGHPDLAVTSWFHDLDYSEEEHDGPPSVAESRVTLRCGRTGERIAEFVGKERDDGFGVAMAELGTYLLVGAPWAQDDEGYVRAHSSRSARPLFEIEGDRKAFLGTLVTGGHDFDRDGVSDVGVSSGSELLPVSGARGDSLPAAEDLRASAFLGSAGDVDLDGVADVAMVGERCELLVRSGATLEPLVTLAFTFDGPHDCMRPSAHTWGIGDVDRDGRGDVLAEIGGDLLLFSGRTGAVTFTFPSEPGEVLNSASGGGDVDGDGVPDFAFARRRSWRKDVRVYSGAARTLLAHFTRRDLFDDTRFGWSLDLTRDLDRDGRADLVVGAPGEDRRGTIDAGAVYVYSGRELADGAWTFGR